eukprot:gene97-biopygen8216
MGGNARYFADWDVGTVQGRSGRSLHHCKLELASVAYNNVCSGGASGHSSFEPHVLPQRVNLRCVITALVATWEVPNSILEDRMLDAP